MGCFKLIFIEDLDEKNVENLRTRYLPFLEGFYSFLPTSCKFKISSLSLWWTIWKKKKYDYLKHKWLYKDFEY